MRISLLFFVFTFLFLSFAAFADEETLNVPGITVTESRLPVVPVESRSESFMETQIADGKTWQSVSATIPGLQINPFGQLHVRGDHNTISYALDGVLLPVIPESELGPLIDPRFLSEFNLQTGNYDASFSGQLGGVISLVPLQAKQSSEAYFEPMVGDHEQREAIGYWDGKSKDGSWNYFVGADASHTNLRLEAPQPNPQTLNNTGDDTDFFIRIHHQEKNDQFNFDIGRQVTNLGIPNTPSAQAAGVVQTEQDANNFGVIAWNHLWSNRSETQFGFSWLNSDQNVTNNGLFTPFVPASTPNANAAGLPANPADPGSPYLPVINRLNHQILLSAVTTHEISETNHIEWGGRADFTHYGDFYDILDAGGIGTLPSPHVVLSLAQDAFTGVVFAADHWTWRDKLHIDLGVNAVQFKDGIDPAAAQINPLLNAAFSLDPKRILRFSYNHLFNTPPLEPDVDGQMHAPAEEANAYDLDYEQELSPVEKIRFGGYLKNFTNQIDGSLLLPMSNLPIFTPQTFPQSVDKGLELAYDSDRKTGFNEFLSYSYSFAQSVATPGNPAVFLDHDQRHTLDFGVSYRTAHGLFASVDNYYGSGFPQAVAQTYNQYGIAPYGITGRVSRFITNLNVGWRPDANGWGASLQILNLFNCTRDINFISDFTGTRFTEERQVRVNANVTF